MQFRYFTAALTVACFPFYGIVTFGAEPSTRPSAQVVLEKDLDGEKATVTLREVPFAPLSDAQRAAEMQAHPSFLDIREPQHLYLYSLFIRQRETKDASFGKMIWSRLAPDFGSRDGADRRFVFLDLVSDGSTVIVLYKDELRTCAEVITARPTAPRPLTEPSPFPTPVSRIWVARDSTNPADVVTDGRITPAGHDGSPEIVLRFFGGYSERFVARSDDKGYRWALVDITRERTKPTTQAAE